MNDIAYTSREITCTW